MFVDDTTMIATIRQIENTYINQKLQFNVSKTIFVKFNTTNRISKEEPISKITEINSIGSTQFLGITVDKNLNWQQHYYFFKLSKQLS